MQSTAKLKSLLQQYFTGLEKASLTKQQTKTNIEAFVEQLADV